MDLGILFYIPNIIGYVRIMLAAGAFINYDNPGTFVVLYTTSIALDGIDGYCARKFNQCSKFGAWLDVVVDLFSRGYLWCALFRNGYLIVFLEWVTFVSTHYRGENWRTTEENFPYLVKKVMDKGFKTPLGFLAVGSLHILPLWLYGCTYHVLTHWLGWSVYVQYGVMVLLTLGRLLCAIVELFYVKEYIIYLISNNVDAKVKTS
ncbi:uncharacterized protein LOC131939662 [Physella acuta]|uniref:uncharacterized protein LOC131939662 n=1 Tax=Physella acuta TaxID=109671 RepID=UPI0027DCB0A4|nr:uncharacterized protein LOC131939662 [Physella acuta]